MGTVVLLICIVASMLLSCSKSTKSSPRQFTYPLAVGNEWYYGVDFDPCSEGEECPDTYAVTVRVEDMDRLSSTSVVFRVHTLIEIDGQVTDGGKSIYENRSDGLYKLAGTHLADDRALPKLLPSTPETIPPLYDIGGTVEASHGFAGSVSTGTDGDSLVWYTSPMLILRYPIEGQWRYITEGDEFTSNIDKGVVDIQTIATPAGSFDCFKIKWYFDSDWGWQITEYVSETGLVKREYRAVGSNDYTTVVLRSFAL